MEQVRQAGVGMGQPVEAGLAVGDDGVVLDLFVGTGGAFLGL